MGIRSIGSKVDWCDETLAAIDRRLALAPSVDNTRSPEVASHSVPRGACVDVFGYSVLVVLLAVAVWSAVSPVLLGLSPVGIVAGSTMLRRMRNPGGEPMGWLYSHLGSMIGGGIAFHMAFAVFGAQRVFSYELAGPLIMLPWMLPTIIGLPAIAVCSPIPAMAGTWRG